MKNKYFPLSLLLAALFFTSLGYAQQEARILQPQLTRDQSLFPLQSTGIWTEVHPLIPRVIYFGVHFANADTGWEVGEGGAIIKTTNGGGKWNWIESGVENTLKTIYSVNNGQRVIAAGDGGIILISEDAGETWSTLPSGTTDNIWNMQMITNEIGWMVGEGATALKTTNAGLTWIQQTMPHTTLPYWDICFADTNYGYIAGNSATIIKTTNGGTDWQTQIAGDNRSLFTVYAFDSLKVIAGGFAGKVVITTDGGNNWTQLPNIQSNVNRIKFFDSLNGFAITTGSNFQSTDGGYTWIYRPDLHNPEGNWNLDFPDLQNGYIAGARMQLMKTADAGVTWSKTIINDDFLNVYLKDEQNGFINSSKKIYKTTDGGATLSVLESFPYYESNSTVAMTFVDSLVGFVGSGNYPKIYKTTDGGVDWNIATITGLIDTLTWFNKIFLLNSEIGWAVTSDGGIVKTTNGGVHWFAQLNILNETSISSIYFTDSLYGWATSVYVYSTTNGGNDWIQRTDIPIYNSNDVYFKDSLNGWLLEGNKLFMTIDGGNTWFQDTQISAYTWRFKTISNSHFIITGNIYESIDTGNTWINITSEVGTGFSDLHAPYNYFSIPIGTIGLILNYTDTTIVPVEFLNFNGEVNEFKVHLSWQTVTEKNNNGFEIHRSKNKIDWEIICFISGKGTTTERQSYFFEDIDIESRSYYYRLKQIDYNGSFKFSDIIEIKIPLDNFALLQNYPNPANPTTLIKYIVPIESFIELYIYDIKGERILNLLYEKKQPVIYTQEINLSNLSSGVYFYTLKSSTGFFQTKKLLNIK
jgi:photosystem II stability/assembly factor-like uncharacterized protein